MALPKAEHTMGSGNFIIYNGLEGTASFNRHKISKMQYACVIVKYHSAIERNGMMINAATQINLKSILLTEMSLLRVQTHTVCSHLDPDQANSQQQQAEW